MTFSKGDTDKKTEAVLLSTVSTSTPAQKKVKDADLNGDGVLDAKEIAIVREYYTDTDENPVRVKPEQVIASTPSTSNVNAQKPTIGLSTPPKFKYADHLYIYSQIKMFNKGSYISALFNIAKRGKLLPYVDPLGRLTQAEATTVVEWLTNNGYIKSFDLKMSI